EILPFCEPMEINKKFAEVKMSVSQPILGLAYKEKPVEKKDRLKVGIISDILSQLLVGDTSDFYEEYYNKGLINPGFGCEYLMGDGYFTVYFSGESKEPETVLNAIRNEISKMKTEGINKERFEAVKNTLLGDAITGTEKTEDIALDMLDMHFMGENRFENVNILVNLTVDDVQKVLANSFDENMSCVVNILPN
ncbi:MAG: insulinase family protein, partial [Oscillospiraceae bacterium]